MGKYTQLTQEQGYQIYAFKKAGFSQAAIAHETGIHKHTVSREIRRNRGKRGYRPKQAHAMAVGGRSKAKKFVKMTPQVVVLIEDLIGQDFSPEQVCGFLNRKHNIQKRKDKKDKNSLFESGSSKKTNVVKVV